MVEEVKNCNVVQDEDIDIYAPVDVAMVIKGGSARCVIWYMRSTSPWVMWQSEIPLMFQLVFWVVQKWTASEWDGDH